MGGVAGGSAMGRLGSFGTQAGQACQNRSAKGHKAVQGGGGGRHKALVVGSVSLWRRLLASRL